MEHRKKRAQALSAGMVPAFLAALVVFDFPFLLRLGIVSIVLFCLGLWLYHDRRFQERILRCKLDKTQDDFLRTWNIYRHDVLNDLQILLGYIRLKKEDKVLEHMDKIKEKLAKDSLVAKLGIPSLILYLLSSRTQCGNMVLNIEMDREINLSQLPLDHDAVVHAIRSIVGHFQGDSRSSDGEPNCLNVEFALSEKRLRLGFVFSGAYDAETLEKSLLPGLKETADSQRWDVHHSFDSARASLSIFIPLSE